MDANSILIRNLEIMKQLVFLLIVGFLMHNVSNNTWAQPDKVSSGIEVPAIIINGDTMPLEIMPTVYFEDLLSGDRKQYLDRLRANIYKVYGYSILAENVIKKMNHDLGSNPTKRERKKYINNLDIELNSKFKEELKNLTQNQGKILVKLINRQTGRSAYELIKELKGGANARMYQTAFSFIDNDLKTQYDPFGKDRDIEMIVQEIEASGYFQHQKIGVKSSNKK